MVGYAVCTVGVVVDEAEIVTRSGEDFGKFAQIIKAVGDGAGSAGFITLWGYWFACLAVNECAIVEEGGRGINSKNRRETRSIYMSFGTIALDGVLYSVEEERIPQEFEHLSFDHRRDIRLEVKEVEIGLVIYFAASTSWPIVQLLNHVWWKMRNGERIGCVIGDFGAGYGRLDYLRSQADLLWRSGREEAVKGSFLRHSHLW